MTERTAKRGETLDGVQVVSWVDTETAAEWCGVDRRTLTNWRKVGLPSRRDPDGSRWFAWPHTAIWNTCRLDWSDGGRRRVERVPFACAWARQQYENACGAAGVAYPARVFHAEPGAPGGGPG